MTEPVIYNATMRLLLSAFVRSISSFFAAWRLFARRIAFPRAAYPFNMLVIDAHPGESAMSTSPPLPPLHYARRALNHAQTAWVDIKIDHMSLDDAIFWDATIQRDIRTQGRAAQRRGETPPRADFRWTWAGIRLLLPLAQWLKGRRCRGLTIFVKDGQGRGIPAGMLLLIERYPWPLPQDPLPGSVFTWFLASAPAESLRALGVPDPPSLGRILIDTALVTSEALNLDGQMWLHAAPPGGARLANFYALTCQMKRLAPGHVLPGGRISDGRHFYTPGPLAKRLTAALQLTR